MRCPPVQSSCSSLYCMSAMHEKRVTSKVQPRLISLPYRDPIPHHPNAKPPGTERRHPDSTTPFTIRRYIAALTIAPPPPPSSPPHRESLTFSVPVHGPPTYQPPRPARPVRIVRVPPTRSGRASRLAASRGSRASALLLKTASRLSHGLACTLLGEASAAGRRIDCDRKYSRTGWDRGERGHRLAEGVKVARWILCLCSAANPTVSKSYPKAVPSRPVPLCLLCAQSAR